MRKSVLWIGFGQHDLHATNHEDARGWSQPSILYQQRLVVCQTRVLCRVQAVEYRPVQSSTVAAQETQTAEDETFFSGRNRYSMRRVDGVARVVLVLVLALVQVPVPVPVPVPARAGKRQVRGAETVVEADEKREIGASQA